MKGRTKYGAHKTIVDSIVFASKKEAARYGELKLLAKAGKIRNLELQPKFPLVVNGTKVCTYIGDFSYFEDNKAVTEDVKGMKTPTYRLKRRLLLAIHPGLDHREV